MIRMGYDSERINTIEERKEFIEGVVSDKKIDKIIDEINEIERD